MRSLVHLTQAPVLAYPCFDHQASEFSLQTDASSVGLGAVLEQDGHVIAYASRSLTASERQYSVIQRECLAVVFALKQFRHYLLGRHYLQAKFAELRDFVEANLAEAAQHQKHAYDQHTSARSFSAGDSVWLSVPTAGKLDPRWEGDWVIKSMKSPITMEITNGRSTKVVHMNRLQHRNVPSYTSCQEAGSHTLDTSQQWNAPTVDHMYLPPPPPVMPRRYPQRQRRAPDRFGF